MTYLCFLEILMSRFNFKEPRMYDLAIARKLGLDTAVILGRLMWSLRHHQETKNQSMFRESKWWTYETLDSLAENTGISRRTVTRAIKKLRELNIIKSRQFDLSAGNARNYYTVLEEAVNDLIVSIDTDGSVTDGIRGVSIDTDGRCIMTLPFSIHNNQANNLTTIYNYNTVKKNLTDSSSENNAKKSKKSKKPPKEITPEWRQLAEDWLEYAKTHSAGIKLQKSWTVENFAKEFMKINRVTGTTSDQLQTLLKFLRNDEFWKGKAKSPFGLLKKSNNGNRKLENLIDAQKGGKHANSSKRYEPSNRLDTSKIDYSKDPFEAYDEIMGGRN